MGRLRSLLTSGSSVVGEREDASTMHTSRSTASLDMDARDQTDQVRQMIKLSNPATSPNGYWELQNSVTVVDWHVP